MPQFAYKARRRTGETVQGVLEVPDRSAALAQIERLGLFPVMVDASKSGAAATAVERSPGASRELTGLLPPAVRNFLQRKRKPKLQELATFTQQLANLLHSGMPLTVALNSMTHLETRGISADVSRQLKQEVMEGKSLSDSMAKQPHIFSPMYMNMVRAGEQSGALVEVLRRLADHFERFAEVQSKFSSALIYPAFVTTAGAIIMFLFMTKMLPTFMEIFDGMNIELPLPTRILMNISYVFSHFWWLMILTVLAIICLPPVPIHRGGQAQNRPMEDDGTGGGQGGPVESVRAIRPHPVNFARKRRSRAHRAANHRGDCPQPHHQGSHRENPG